MFDFNYKYLSEKHLKGFEKYKYSAVDTSPLSNYVMHPLWNLSIKVIPSWIAPNLITFVGFLFLLADVLVITVLDYHNDAAGTDEGQTAMSLAGDNGIPNWVYTMCGIFLFINYNLDGIDGKQARKIGVSGPIGELFDHGLDSYVVFFVPYCLISIFGRGEYSVPPIRIYVAIVSITLNYYVSHCEKYNTGTLYLPWGYDFSMWVSSLVCIVAGAYGPAVYKTYVLSGMTFMQVLEIAIHVTGFLSTLPVAVYNVYLSYKHRTGKMYPLLEALRPVYAMVLMVSAMTTWALISPNNIVDHQLRPFLLLLGTMFSNISCRLIVAQMSSQRCDAINEMTWPLVAGVALSSYYPSLEVAILYLLLLGLLYAHIHYGVCVVRQMCGHFKVKCFSVSKIKKK